MNIPKFTSPVPTTIIPTGNIPTALLPTIPTVSAPKLPNFSDSIPKLGTYPLASIPKTPSIDSLTGAARAKAISKLPTLPDVKPGISGVLTPDIDVFKLQSVSVGNLTSRVSKYSPGKSILGLSSALAKIKSATDKLGALVPAGVKNIAGGALSGAALGAIGGALKGTKPSLSSVGGSLVGGLAGGVGAKVGSLLAGSNSTAIPGVGAIAGSVASGFSGGSLINKAVTGLAVGTGVGVLSGIIGKSSPTLNTNTENSAPTSAPSEPPATPQSKPPTSVPPDLTKNTTEEISSMADKSSQSVPVAVPPPVSGGLTNTPTTSVDLLDDSTDTLDIASKKYKESAALAGSLAVSTSGGTILSLLYTSDIYDLEDFKREMRKITPKDRDNLKIHISKFSGTFSGAYTSFTADKNPDPKLRKLNLNNYLSFDNDTYYKFLTSVASGEFEIGGKDAIYRITTTYTDGNSTGVVTISNSGYGTATFILPRITPPTVDVLFSRPGVIDTFHLYALGKTEKSILTGTIDMTSVKGGAVYRMWSNLADTFIYSPCGGNLLIKELYVGTALDKNSINILKPNWVNKKIDGSKDTYYEIEFNPYTLRVVTVGVLKLLKKT